MAMRLHHKHPEFPITASHFHIGFHFPAAKQTANQSWFIPHLTITGYLTSRSVINHKHLLKQTGLSFNHCVVSLIAHFTRWFQALLPFASLVLTAVWCLLLILVFVQFSLFANHLTFYTFCLLRVLELSFGFLSTCVFNKPAFVPYLTHTWFSTSSVGIHAFVM